MNSWNREPLGQLVNIGLPIGLLLVAISSFIWFAIEVKKKRLEFKSMATWLSLNILFTFVIFYILIVAVLNYFHIGEATNIFNLIAYYLFGLELENGKEWVILLILAFISYILVKSLSNSIKISKLNKRVDELGKEVAVLSGKVNKTANFKKSTYKSKTNSKEVKSELKEMIRIAKAKKAAELKMEKIKSPKKAIITRKKQTDNE